MVIHREDVITRFSVVVLILHNGIERLWTSCEIDVSEVSWFWWANYIIYWESGRVNDKYSYHYRIVTSIHASPNELMKRRVVEKELCKQLSELTSTNSFVFDIVIMNRVIVIMNSEAPFALKNELQTLQGERLYYHIPSNEYHDWWWLIDDDQRRHCIESLLSRYDNELSEYCLQRLLIHSSCFSLHQITSLFDQLYYCMILCKYNQIDPSEFDLDTLPKSQQYPAVVSFCNDISAGKE